MNLLLNKIDTDIRRKLYEGTKNGKVHAKDKICIYKDSEKERKNNFKRCLEEKQKQTNKIVIEAQKPYDGEIVINAEKEDKDLSYNIIDVRK